jgi:Flp pilus assembly protein TadD
VTIYDKEGKLSDALRFLTQERVNYPQHASFLYQLQAEILKKINHKPAAIELLDEAIHNLPDDPDLIYAQVLLLDPYQDRDRLEQDLNKLLNIEPNSPTYLNAYAYTLALQNRRLEDARKYVEHALEYAPDQASILDTYGLITFLQNDFTTAIPVLQKAYLLNNNLATGIRLAKALYLQGNSQQFTSLLQQLKQKHPNDPQVIQLNSLLLPQQQKMSFVHHASVH